MRSLLFVVTFFCSTIAQAELSGGGLTDFLGNGITSQASGSQRSLDIGINVSGSQVDPRTRTWNLSSSDVPACTQGTAAALSASWPVKLTDGTNTLPTGDVNSRGIFVKPGDGSNAQSYTASGEAKVLVTPLTNSSVVKAQLQDNSGTAITVGQKAMSSSFPVVLSSDQTGMNTFLDKSGSGTISALNGAVTIATNGASNIYMSITGTWVAALGLQADSGDGTWAQTLGKLPFPSGAIAAIIGSNVSMKVPCGGMKQVRIIATSYTSGTATVAWNTGAGVGLTEVFNNDAASLQMTANAGTNLNTSALALSATQTNGNQKTQIVDGSGNVITSTSVNGTTTNKQPIDVNPFPTAALRYSTGFVIQQSAATAANSSVFTLRNGAASSRSLFLDKLNCVSSFNASTPITRANLYYTLNRFSGATPSGGTQITTIGKGDPGDPTSQVGDVRFSDTGITMTGTTVDTGSLDIIPCSNTSGIFCNYSSDLTSEKFGPGDGAAIRLGVTAQVGQSLACTLKWREQ